MLNNRKGSKNKIQGSYRPSDIYKDYKEQYGDNPMYNVTSTIYLAILKEYYQALIQAMLFKGYVFKMPLGLGYLGIIKRMTNNTRHTKHCITIDWIETKKYGKWIAFDNQHSGGFKVKYMWSKVKSRVRHVSLYRLVMSRYNKRLLASAVKVHGCDYPENKLIII